MTGSRVRIRLLVAGICIGLLPLVATGATAMRFEAGVDRSHWRTTESRFHCTLEHTIPRFGTARFAIGSGGRLQFAVLPERALPFAAQHAVLRSEPPAWRHYDVARTLLAEVDMTAGESLIRLDEHHALRLLQELEKGFFPVLRYDEEYAGDRVEVAVSAVNFRQVLPRFRACIADLYPVGFADVELTSVHFDWDRDSLREDGRQALQRLLDYFYVDPSVRLTIVSGHTDSTGRAGYNAYLAQRRAETVHAWLIRNGMLPEQLEIRHHGEDRPLADNRTDEGRARNRRVEIRLLR